MKVILRNINPVTPRKIPLEALVLLLALFASFSLLIQPVNAADLTDTTPPVLTSFDFNPKAVDVTSEDTTVEITMHVTDDLSGFAYAEVYFQSPSQGQGGYSGRLMTTGSPLDADVQGTLNIPQFSEAGDWSVYAVRLYDNTHNYQSLDKAALDSLGFPSTLTVTSQDQDVTPPQLNSFQLAPVSIDVSSGPQSITFTMGITDFQSGCQYSCGVFICLQSPSGKQSQCNWALDFFQLSGTDQDGIWQGDVTLPQYAEPGLWKVEFLTLSDMLGNGVHLDTAGLQSRGFPSTFTVASSPSDTLPPQLTSVAYTPNFVDATAGGQNITFTMGATDNLSGIDAGVHGTPNFNVGNISPLFSFRSPSGSQGLTITPITLLTGTATNGTWQGSGYLPQYSEAGTWNLTLGHFRDAAGNNVIYDNAQLKAMGFPTTLEVILPSLITDGTISDPAAGGTVQDDVFGNRAQVTAPSGVLNQPTDVALDVLSSDLQLPIPSGFATTGTYYMNIKLNPEPNYPFNAPGLTIVLPLPSQTVTGSKLVLFRVDPITGTLIPEPSVFGGSVVGTVNSDGLSATFTGLAQLSTLVGLVPSRIVLGDLDGDGKVNCADVGIVKWSFGAKLGQTGFDARADTNRDNVINGRDLSFVLRYLPHRIVCRIKPDPDRCDTRRINHKVAKVCKDHR